METAPRNGSWLRLVIAVVAVSAAFSALLTYLIFTMPSADPLDFRPGLAQLLATWLMFTFLLALVFAAGIWRMTGWNDRPGVPHISPVAALIVLAAIIGICGSSALAVGIFSFVDPKIVMFGVLAIAVVVAFLIVRPFRNRAKSPPPDGSASA